MSLSYVVNLPNWKNVFLTINIESCYNLLDITSHCDRDKGDWVLDPFTYNYELSKNKAMQNLISMCNKNVCYDVTCYSIIGIQ